MNINPAVAENRYPVIESKRRFGPGAVETRRQAVASLPSIRFDQRLLRSVGADADSDDDQPSAFICSPIHELNSATVFGVSTVISIVEYIGDVHDAFCVTMITLSGTVSRGSTEVFGIVAGGRTDGEHGAGEMMVAVVAGSVRWRSLRIITTIPFRQNAMDCKASTTKPLRSPRVGGVTQPLGRNAVAQDSMISGEIIGTLK